jgi:hypothetical protein
LPGIPEKLRPSDQKHCSLCHIVFQNKGRCDESPICCLAVKYCYLNPYTTRNHYHRQDRNI